MRIALVTDFLLVRRGAERVFELFVEMFPDADIFTLLHDERQVPFNNRKIITSYLQKIPVASRLYKNLYPFYPSAIESLNLKGYDIVISTTAMWAHGVISHPDTLHISYMHSPFRYSWYLFPEYMTSKFKKNWFNAAWNAYLLSQIRLWDTAAVHRVHVLVANSINTKNKISAYYRLDSQVVYPSIDVKKYPFSAEYQNYYLFVGELLPYKGVGLLVDTFRRSHRNLVVIGQGPELEKLSRQTRPFPNIRLLGWQDDSSVKSYMANCRAVIVPGEEDFGLVSLEAHACGKPVIAYAAGGSKETILERQNGIFFKEQTPNALMASIETLEKSSFDPVDIRRSAFRFDHSVFKEKWASIIKLALEGKYGNMGLDS